MTIPSLSPEEQAELNARVKSGIARTRKAMTQRLLRAIATGNPDSAGMSPIDLSMQVEFLNEKLNRVCGILLAMEVATQQTIGNEFTEAIEKVAEDNEKRLAKMPTIVMPKGGGG